MKKLLYLFLATSLIFSSCSEDDDITTPITNQFSGNWTGTYTGDDSGIWAATIASNGTVNGNSTNANGDLQSLSGSVTNSGTFSATVGTGTLGSSFTGTLSGNNGIGVWENSSFSLTGTWAGEKQ
tara:strand:+ start:138 stop:512 length:375 start_codon:yes stop_codon:yes gene_type:complete